MKNSSWKKPLILFATIFAIVSGSFMLVVALHEDGGNRVAFSLTDHHNQPVNQTDLAGKYQLVFFGFTSCADICPTQMSKLTQVMSNLDQTGHGQRVTPVFITVDPERDHPEKVASYLRYFDDRFVGLTGSRDALGRTAESFKTFLQASPVDKNEQRTGMKDYQVTHSSIVYLVDPFSRIVDYIAFDEGYESIAARVRDTI